MLSKESKEKKDSYFQLPPEDRMEFELEDKEKEEKKLAAEKILHKPTEGK